ncbi:Dimeric alpha-beta barrel [Lasallia pustulata]|uniref:Dimeric alpha-beta barrel n=1 Tax=Lasallia pustulata TaxID=136370 RepID=A0A1W5D3E9_9LECA|nr:Dimeric alpha-beta barrel [Lasallia pustulata]
MPPPIKVVATITPAPGKLDRLVEVLAKLAAAVERKEHGCLEYHLHRRVRDVGPQQGEQGWAGEELVMIETQRNQGSTGYERASKAQARSTSLIYS